MTSAANRSPASVDEERLDRPVLARREREDLALALDDEPNGDRLDAAGRQAAADLARQQRAQRVADEPIDDPPGLLGVDEVHVDVARVGERLADRGFGDLVERDPAGLVARDRGRLGDVPGDRLALAVEVGGEEDRVGAAGGLRDVRDLLAPVVRDHVFGLEVVVDVHAELALARVFGQVADMAVARQDPVIVTEIALDGAGLGRGFNDDEVLWHGRECSTGSLARPYSGPALTFRPDQTSRIRRRKSSSISRSGSGSAARPAGRPGPGRRR